MALLKAPEKLLKRVVRCLLVITLRLLRLVRHLAGAGDADVDDGRAKAFGDLREIRQGDGGA